MTSLQTRIETTLADSKMTARALAKTLGTSKTEVNRLLYQMDTVAKVQDGPPPVWTLKTPAAAEAKTNEAAVCLVVIVDLGNVHDVLQHLGPYVASGCIHQVWAYADLQFNGYGVKPPPDYECRVYQAQQPHPNAADNKIVWDVAVACAAVPAGGAQFHFVVVTKDQGFQNLADLVYESKAGTLEFVNSWEDLRNVIE